MSQKRLFLLDAYALIFLEGIMLYKTHINSKRNGYLSYYGIHELLNGCHKEKDHPAV
jgi:hypothetical protein